MYRDDPLEDEEELRAVVGDAAVDVLLDARPSGPETPAEVALDVLRLLQGWVDDASAGAWFHAPQRRLAGRSPIDALRSGAVDEVREAARKWAASQG